MIGLKFKGRPAINFAETVKDVAHFKNEYAQIIMDRSQEITEDLIGAIIAQGIMSYEGRNPQPAINANGRIITSDLDLLSFLAPIADRGAVIEIPRYQNRRKVVKKNNERKIGSNQFGPITGLVSNKDVFSFSVRIHDKTIAVKDANGKEDLGAYRTYMMIDCDGTWYNGWNRIVWDPTRKENQFLIDNNIWSGNCVVFKYYVHPNRWQSVFGAPHLLKKMLISRINDEAKFYRAEIKRLNSLGIIFPKSNIKQYTSTIYEGQTEAIKVKTMEMLLTHPDFSGSYTPVSNDMNGLAYAYNRQKLLTYSWKSAVQFVVRANEAAYMMYGLDDSDNGKIAHWMGSRVWRKWRNSSRSSLYNQMVLSNDMALLYRTKMKTEHISID